MTTDAQIGSEFVWYLTDMLGDAEGDRLSYSVSLANGDPLPAWLTLDPVTGQLVGTPTATDMGSMELIGTASDGSGLASSVSMTVSVIAVSPDSGGDDTYVVNPNDGVTHITDTGGNDTLVFGEGITPDAVTLGLGSLLIRTGLDGNEVHIEDFDPEAPLESAAIEQFVFADGTVLSLAELLARGFDIAGEGELNGTALRDRITGGAGADVFNGGRGDDQLLGGAGDDTYHYRLGDGVDQIVDGQGVDRIVIGDGISAADVVVSRANGLVTLTLSATDSLSFAENTAGDYAIERIEFADGSQWQAADVLNALARSRPEVGQAIDGSAAEEDAPWHFTLPEESFVDADLAAGDVLSLTAGLANGAPLPDWLRFDAASRRFSGVPTNDDVGLLSIRVTATDRAGNEVSQVFSLTVSNVNDAPTGTVSIEGAATENQTLSAASLLADLDGMGPVSYQWQSSSDGATWRDVAGATDATLVLGATQVGKQMRVVASYTDERGTGESVVSNITDTVARFNHAPVAASPIGDTSARRGALFTFAIPGGAFVDADAGDHLSYSATLANGEALPAWLQFAAETGTFSGTPGTSDIGVVVVQVTATDLAGAHSSQTFTLAVEAGNPDHAPIAEPDAAIVIEDSKRRAQGNVLTNDRDPEGKRLRVADPSNQHGEYGTLTLRANGTYVYVLDDASTKVQGLGAGETATDSFEYTVSDGKQRSGGKLVVTVKGTNDTPDLVHRLADVQLAKGKEFAWHVPEGSFQDADVRDTLSYSATLANGKALPAWLKFDAATQTFSGTAPAGAKGSINVRVTASDGHGARTTASDDFKISFGNQTIVPAALSGNEGAGNGADAPPPVANANASFDESSGMSPGQPGRNAGVAASQRTSQATVEPQSQRAESSASGDANLDQWLAAATVPWSANDSPSGTGASLSSDDAAAKPPGSGSGPGSGRNAGPLASRTLAQWQQMDAALAKHLGAAEDDSLGSDPAATANAAPQLATAIDPFAALAGASNSLRTLKGLNEGLRKGG